MSYSTVQAASKLGVSLMSLHRYMKAGKIPIPKMQRIFGVRVRVWTDEDIERVRSILPKIANGRKTRYQKLRKKEKAQAKGPVPNKKGQTKKKRKTR